VGVDRIKLNGNLFQRGIGHGLDGPQGMILGHHGFRGDVAEHGLSGFALAAHNILLKYQLDMRRIVAQEAVFT